MSQATAKYVGKQSATLRGGKTLLQSLPLGVPELLRLNFMPVADARLAINAAEEASNSSSSSAAAVGRPAGRLGFGLPAPHTLRYDANDSGALQSSSPPSQRQQQQRPATAEEAAEAQRRFVALLAQELELGAGTLSKWRGAYHSKETWGRRIAASEAKAKKELGGSTADADAVSASVLTPRALARRVCGETASTLGTKTTSGGRNTTDADAKFVESAVMVGNCVIAPFVALKAVPSPSSHEGSGSAASTASGLEGTTTFVATRNIPAGVFLLSVPTEEALLANVDEGAGPALAAFHAQLEEKGLLHPTGDPRAATDPAPYSPRSGLSSDDVRSGNAFFIAAEEIAMHLAMGMDAGADEHGAEDGGPTFFSSYVSHLLETVRPPRNLPYLTAAEMDPTAEHAPNSPASSLPPAATTAAALWRHLHTHRAQQPMNLAAFRQLLLNESYEDQLEMYRNSVRTSATIVSNNTSAAGTYGGTNEENSSAGGGDDVNMLELSAHLPPLPPDALAEFKWLLSAALSRRLGASLLVPLLDKLNHCCSAAASSGSGSDSSNPSLSASKKGLNDDGGSSQTASPATEEESATEQGGEAKEAPNNSSNKNAPNAYYTMATEEAMCGLDVLDNLLAGVPAGRLYEPHVHLFALRSIRAGEAITLSYSDLDPSTPSFSPHQQQTATAAESKLLEGETSTSGSNESGGAAAEATSPPPPPPLGDDDGAALWRATWGFVPEDKPLLPESDLLAMASIVAERRLLSRARMFPPDPPAANNSRN